MSGNESNASNTTRAKVIVRDGGKAVMAIAELFVLAEILWYYLHDGEQTFHEAIAEWWESRKAQATREAEIFHTRMMIENLPETSE